MAVLVNTNNFSFELNKGVQHRMVLVVHLFVFLN